MLDAVEVLAKPVDLETEFRSLLLERSIRSLIDVVVLLQLLVLYGIRQVQEEHLRRR